MYFLSISYYILSLYSILLVPIFYNIPILIEDSIDYKDNNTEFKKDINTINSNNNRNTSENTASLAFLPRLPY